MPEANVWNYVIAAYVVAWVGLIGYSVRLLVLTRRAKKTIEELGGEG